jgi:hypothetical protein
VTVERWKFEILGVNNTVITEVKDALGRLLKQKSKQKMIGIKREE